MPFIVLLPFLMTLAVPRLPAAWSLVTGTAMLLVAAAVVALFARGLKRPNGGAMLRSTGRTLTNATNDERADV